MEIRLLCMIDHGDDEAHETILEVGDRECEITLPLPRPPKHFLFNSTLDIRFASKRRAEFVPIFFPARYDRGGNLLPRPTLELENDEYALSLKEGDEAAIIIAEKFDNGIQIIVVELWGQIHVTSLFEKDIEAVSQRFRSSPYKEYVESLLYQERTLRAKVSELLGQLKSVRKKEGW